MIPIHPCKSLPRVWEFLSLQEQYRFSIFSPQEWLKNMEEPFRIPPRTQSSLPAPSVKKITFVTNGFSKTEGVGFEPTVQFPGQHISSVLLSTAQPTLLSLKIYHKIGKNHNSANIKEWKKTICKNCFRA